MFFVCIACLFPCYLQSVVVSEELAPPQDVTLITFNTNYTLSWDWHHNPAENHNVTFTTQYVGKYKLQRKKSPSWNTVCNEASHRSCDLTAVGLHYLGMYKLRVRANINRRHSEWVLKEFCPDKDAVLGQPSKVNIAVDGRNLEISISEPVTSNNITMKTYIPTLRYHIVYWERSLDTQTQRLTSDSLLIYLSDLKAWTYYCVSVQSRYDFYNKSSIFTSPQCIQTEVGNVPWWQICLYFLGSLLACFLVVLLSFCTSFWCYKTIKATFYPSIQLPSILKKYICKSTGSEVPGLLTPDPEIELLCERVSIGAATIREPFGPPPEPLLVPPLGLEPDIRYSHQDSSSSGDSGVYVTGGRLNMQQCSVTDSCTGVKDFWQGTIDLEQVKMERIAPGLKGQLLITDEGIVDTVQQS